MPWLWACGGPGRWAKKARAETADLAYTNEALRQWLALMENDRVYLVVDRQAGEVRLQHGKAVLRQCPIVGDFLGRRPDITGKLQQRVRRYRPRTPWAQIESGAFDWENNLAEEATDRCALFFDSGVLIYASAAWGQVRPPSLRLTIEDVRALYNAGAEGLDLVILPPAWDQEVRHAK